MKEIAIKKVVELMNTHYLQAKNTLKNWSKLDSLNYAIDMINNEGYTLNLADKEKKLLLSK